MAGSFNADKNTRGALQNNAGGILTWVQRGLAQG